MDDCYEESCVLLTGERSQKWGMRTELKMRIHLASAFREAESQESNGICRDSA